MSGDKDKSPTSKRFWSNIFRSRSSRKAAKLEKDPPWTPPDEPPSRPTGPARAQTQLRPRNAGPVQHPRPPAKRTASEPRRATATRRSTSSSFPSSPPSSAHPPRPAGAAPGRKGPKTDSDRPRPPPDGRAQAVVPLGPLTQWPPWGVPATAELPLSSAMELIARGAPIHHGHRRDVPHAPTDYYTLYATSSGNQIAGPAAAPNADTAADHPGDPDSPGTPGGSSSTDGADLYNAMLELMTMRTTYTPGVAPLPAMLPWETLEQPSFAFRFGRRPGTITLNHWTGQAGVTPPAIALRDSGVRPRDIDLVQICQRLRELQRDGLEENDPDRLYHNLYRRLLRDPDRAFQPRRTLDKQITDLIMALSRPDHWIDLTHARNQIVTRFIFDASLASHAQYLCFFHQLLLSVELDLRISSRHHTDWAKHKLLLQLPPTLQIDLALARRWREHVRIDAYGSTADQVKLRFKTKSRQIRRLRRFARVMKWPNLAATVANLKQRDADGTLESISSHAMAFFSSLVLPGPTYPFIIMNALIDIDPDRATDDLSLLAHTHPSCGFQYRNSYTYWTATCIVGKVLAPTCRELAGWIGPARPSVDLGRSQIARIRSRRLKKHISVENTVSMSERSDPLGPPAQVFPVADYKLVSTDPTDMIDTVRIELLSLRPATTASSTFTDLPSAAGHPNSAAAANSPRWFDASVQFAIDGVSWPLRLNFDVSFLCAWPCSNGPHPLFNDYAFAVVKADMVVDVHDWATPPPAGTSEHSQSRTSSPAVHFGGTRVLGPQFPPVSKDGDEEKVLVIEAFGVPDNEVLARAWCAHWGLSAIVADVNKTCMACAIREAYAATITVVILVDGHTPKNDD